MGGKKNRKKKKTISERFRVVNEKGMHLAAAGEIVKLTNKFKAKVTLAFEGNKVNGKSLLSIISLAVPCGSWFRAYAEGDDAVPLLRGMAKLVASGFGAGAAKRRSKVKRRNVKH